MVGISPIFVCLGQFRCVYDPVLSVVDNICWYITWFCLLWTVMVGIVPDLSVLDNIGWYISLFCLSWTKMDGISTGFVCHGNNC